VVAVDNRRNYIAIGPIGSRRDTLHVFRTNVGIYVRTGCYAGTLQEFGEAVNNNHGDDQHGKDYAAAIVFIRTALI
jgi:hypothetical protein